MGQRVLVVEDEADIRDLVCHALQRAGYQGIPAESVENAQSLVESSPPDLLILDWMLPGLSGIDYARRLRRSEPTKSMPIIMLSAKGDSEDKVKGLDAGIDDYLSKPFSQKELIARVKAVLRRTRTEVNEEGMVQVDGLAVDTVSHIVSANGETLSLSLLEFNLLHFFLTHQGRVYSRAQLLDNVWGHDRFVEERTVDVHVRRLRKALEQTGHDRLIKTVRGVGYRCTSN